MYKFTLQAHSGWAYIVLILLIIAVINALIGMSSKKPFTANDRRISLMALVAAHIQLVFGLLLYFTSPNGLSKIQAVGMGGMTALDRLLALEHPLMNIIALVLITVGWSKHKKALDEKKFRTISIFYGIGLIFLLSRIPWGTWFA